MGGYGLMAGGAVLGGLGAMLGAAGSNRAGRQARDWYAGRTGEGAQRLLELVYGPGAASAWRDVGLGTPGASEKLAGMCGGSILQQLASAGQASKTHGQGIVRDFDKQSASLRGGADQFGGRLQSLYSGAEGLASGWGEGRSRLISEDYDRAARNATGRASARLSASGFGNSTAVANQAAAIEGESERNKQRSLQDVSEARVDRQLGARLQGAGAMGDWWGAQRGYDYQRAADRTGLQERNLGRNDEIALRPINTQLSLLTGGALNPWLGQRPSQYYPGQSGLGGALGEIGGGLARYGGYLQGQNNVKDLLKDPEIRRALGMS